MKQTAEHEVTVRTRYPQEDWPVVLVKAMLDNHSIKDDRRIVSVESHTATTKAG